MVRKFQIVCVSVCALLLALILTPAVAQQQSTASAQNPLVEILKSKGVLTADDVASINHARTKQEADQKLNEILYRHGVISKAEYDRLTAQEAQAAAVAPAPAPAAPKTSIATKAQNVQAPPFPTEPGAPSVVERAPVKGVNAALAPIRALPVGQVKIDEHPSFKADGVGITPYGFLKVTAVEDSSNPQGADFPLPGLIFPTDPSGDPAFHLKARSTRMGLNFSWYDKNPKWAVTGKLEFDFEGNFSAVDNRNLSSIRSNAPSLRLAYVRLGYQADANNTFSLLFGQDWTTFASSTLPNILETTGLGIDFGSLYERLPQMRVGYTHKSGAFSFTPEFSIALPASGLVPDVTDQLGYGEQAGPDSNQPQYQGRLVFQFPLDHAKGVAPAQIIFSGFEGKTGSDYTAANITSAIAGTEYAYVNPFTNGYSTKSKQDGWDMEWQLPTRWFTLVGKFYSGSDLFFYFAGQLQSYYNDTKGLYNTVAVSDVDGGAPLGLSSGVLGTTTATGHTLVFAPQRPVRSEGGFAQLGIPLSRIFNADPAGRNAGWSLYALYGVDQAKRRDLQLTALQDRYSTMAIGTINYKFNRWASFSYEETLYTTHCNPGVTCSFRGNPAREWNDIREEAGPIFTF
ncbi:MAG: hypothetical protein WBY53_12500 [Acidobacteriaceae bacterium]